MQREGGGRSGVVKGRGGEGNIDRCDPLTLYKWWGKKGKFEKAYQQIWQEKEKKKTDTYSYMHTCTVYICIRYMYMYIVDTSLRTHT